MPKVSKTKKHALIAAKKVRTAEYFAQQAKEREEYWMEYRNSDLERYRTLELSHIEAEFYKEMQQLPQKLTNTPLTDYEEQDGKKSLTIKYDLPNLCDICPEKLPDNSFREKKAPLPKIPWVKMSQIEKAKAIRKGIAEEEIYKEWLAWGQAYIRFLENEAKEQTKTFQLERKQKEISLELKKRGIF